MTIDLRSRMTSAATHPGFADDELGELLDLNRGPDRLEAKLDVPEFAQRSSPGDVS